MANQDDYIKTALRLPRGLHAKLLQSAESAGRSLNSEILARLESSYSAPDQSVFNVTLARLEGALAHAELEYLDERANSAKFATSLRFTCEQLLPFVTDRELRSTLETWITEATQSIHGISQLEIDFKEKLAAAAQITRKLEALAKTEAAPSKGRAKGKSN